MCIDQHETRVRFFFFLLLVFHNKGKKFTKRPLRMTSELLFGNKLGGEEKAKMWTRQSCANAEW